MTEISRRAALALTAAAVAAPKAWSAPGKTTPFQIVAEGLVSPEGPVVFPDGSVIVAEIHAGRLTRIWGDGRREVVATPGAAPNGAKLGPDGALYVCNSGGGAQPYSGGRIERVDLATGKVERLYDKVGDTPLQMPNDLVFDAQGGLWFTDYGRREARWTGKGGIYWVPPGGGAVREVWFGGAGCNGIGLSPDGRTLYWATTISGRLYSFPVTGPGTVATNEMGLPRYVASAAGDGAFDSLALTASGAICIGTASPGGITVVTPPGKTRFLPLPDLLVSNIAFGGADMRDAYVTMSRSGRLAKLRWDEPGLNLNF
jgi:gluconolactonase